MKGCKLDISIHRNVVLLDTISLVSIRSLLATLFCNVKKSLFSLLVAM